MKKIDELNKQLLENIRRVKSGKMEVREVKPLNKSDRRIKEKRIEHAILTAATKGQYKAKFIKAKDGVKPAVVKQFYDKFDETEDGVIALKGDDGSFAIDEKGNRITAKKYFSGMDKFKRTDS